MGLHFTTPAERRRQLVGTTRRVDRRGNTVCGGGDADLPLWVGAEELADLAREQKIMDRCLDRLWGPFCTPAFWAGALVAKRILARYGATRAAIATTHFGGFFAPAVADEAAIREIVRHWDSAVSDGRPSLSLSLDMPVSVVGVNLTPRVFPSPRITSAR